MPSTFQNTLRLGLLLSLIGLASPIYVRANEPMPTNESGDIYRAFHPEPLQTDATHQSFKSESAYAPTRQTAPLATVMDEGPAREPARLFRDERTLEQIQPITGIRPDSQAGSRSTNRFANRGSTAGGGQVHPVNHLRPQEEPAQLPDARSSASVQTDYRDPQQTPGRLAQNSPTQLPPEESDQFSPRESKTTPIPFPQSSTTSTILPQKGEDSKEKSRSSGLFPMLATMGGALLLVIGLFLVFAWMMRRTSTRTGGLLPQGVVEVLGHQTIVGRQQVHLLRIGKRLLLVSVMPDSVKTLTEITDPTEVDRIAGICRQSGSGSSTGVFQTVMQQFNQESATNPDQIPTVDQLRQRLGG